MRVILAKQRWARREEKRATHPWGDWVSRSVGQPDIGQVHLTWDKGQLTFDS